MSNQFVYPSLMAMHNSRKLIQWSGDAGYAGMCNWSSYLYAVPLKVTSNRYVCMLFLYELTLASFMFVVDVQTSRFELQLVDCGANHLELPYFC